MLVRAQSSTGANTTLSESSSSAGWKCQVCSDGGQIEIVSVPYVFRYLVAELAAMNIRVELSTS